jgi:ketosteroid isomerase-like protein
MTKKLIVCSLMLLGLAFGHGRAQAAGPSPADAVDAFHKALRVGDAKAVLALLAPEIVIFEQGFFEPSRDAYAETHMRDDMDFARATKREVLSREAITSGDAAWVQSRTRTTGKFGDNAVDLTGAETMVLRRQADGWKIVHIHWSAHNTAPQASAAPVKPEKPGSKK